jgi:hypothetical protein
MKPRAFTEARRLEKMKPFFSMVGQNLNPLTPKQLVQWDVHPPVQMIQWILTHVHLKNTAEKSVSSCCT